jgi:tetratricopeptide (TPR) repeat protein
MGKDIEKSLNKANQLYNAMQYKKAAKAFTSLGNSYVDLGDYVKAKLCFFNAAKSYLEIEKFFQSIDSLRNAGGTSLFNNNFIEAYDFYKTALEYVPNLKNSSDRYYHFLLFSCLSFLCLLIKGRQEEGLNLVKKFKNYVDDRYFKENNLIRLVKDLTIAINDKKIEYLRKVEHDFHKFNFRKPEIDLTKKALVIAKTYNSLKTHLNLDKNVYTTNDLITLTLKIDTKPLLEISDYVFYEYQIKELKITKIGIKISDNFTTQEKLELPIILNPGQIYNFEFKIKPHFQLEKPFIGPILLTSELDGELIFYHETTQQLIPNLISPPPSLEVSIKNLRPPLIDKTFPLEILLENKSEGEALDLNVEVDFPDEIKVMRGTLKKQIYSLKPNEDMKWEINLKPLEAGDYIIKIDTTFKDPDSNQITQTKEFPFSIKL